MKRFTRILALALASVLLFSLVPFTVSAAENFEITEFDYGYWGPTDTPLLVILVNLDPDSNQSGENNETLLRHNDHSYWSEMFFGDDPKGMKSYFEIQSGGNFRFIPAEENYANASKNNVANDGVVEVTVKTSVAKSTKGSTSDPERYDALAVAVTNGYVDFSVYDKNGDNRVTEDELMVAFIVAGYEYTRNGSDTPSYNAHKSSFSYGFNGISVSTDYVKCGEMIDQKMPLTVGSFCHELGHALGNGDLYTAGGGNWGGGNDDNNNNWGGGGMPIAAPANPSEWAVEEVGIVRRFKVDEEDGNDIIKFNHFEIRVVNFEGFVNYGSPITAGIANENQIEHITLTENRIDMPIFSRRYINSHPGVYDGHTIAIGGMIQDEVQKVEDKVPVFGDLPLIGRLFRSNAESHIRKNLMVFVTADVIDPFGKPMRKRDTGTTTAGANTSVPGLFPDDGLVNP